MKKLLLLLLCATVIFSAAACNKKIPAGSQAGAVDGVGTDTSEVTSSDVISCVTDTTPPPSKEQQPVFDYWYSHMTDVQQGYYNKFLREIESMNTEPFFISSQDIDISANINIVLMGVLSDHPEIFWVSGAYELLMNNYGEYYLTIEYQMEKPERDSRRVSLENKVSALVENAKGMSCFEKEVYFHDYLCQNTVYTSENGRMCYTSYGALLEGKAVCEGYSRAMQLLCKRSGINCTLVRGTADGVPHMWNIIELLGEWYHLDVTWDDATSQIGYDYFNLTSDGMFKTHTADQNLKNDRLQETGLLKAYNYYLPLCTATYFNQDRICK